MLCRDTGWCCITMIMHLFKRGLSRRALGQLAHCVLSHGLGLLPQVAVHLSPVQPALVVSPVLPACHSSMPSVCQMDRSHAAFW